MYKTFYQAAELLDDKSFREFFLKLGQYCFDGIDEPSDNQTVNMAMVFCKNSLDRAEKRRQAQIHNGKKGGAPKGNTNAKKQPKQPNSTQNNLDTNTKKQPKQPNSTQNNLNEYVNDNVNDNDISSSTSNIYNLNNLNNKNINKEKENLININKEVISSTSTSKDDNNEINELQKQIVKNCKILLNCKIKRKMNIDEQDVYDDTIKLFEQVYNIDEISSKEKIKSYINFLYNKN